MKTILDFDELNDINTNEKLEKLEYKEVPENVFHFYVGKQLFQYYSHNYDIKRYDGEDPLGINKKAYRIEIDKRLIAFETKNRFFILKQIEIKKVIIS